MFQSLLAALRGSVGSSCLGNRPWLLLLLLATLYSSLASAVGLGEITVHSALNQPLEAEIALVQAQGLEEGELAVSLATAGEFKQAGVERLPFLEDLRFTPILQGERRVIRVVSSKPVNEPFLDFLLQVNQANGRQLREYTLLIDPPGSPEIVPAPAREVAKPEPTIATQAPQRRPRRPILWPDNWRKPCRPTSNCRTRPERCRAHCSNGTNNWRASSNSWWSCNVSWPKSGTSLLIILPRLPHLYPRRPPPSVHPRQPNRRQRPKARIPG
ncbi:Tfp pilus assembly protein FimV [Pseudomonas chlororaphis subsp. aureofaciens]|uniref:Tfp pilus assembly protein FimV n=2 Tax=Pseudomonas chlororaphis TaxID=587753 RepID=A0AAD1E4V3_9PSED|nr:Tfp pilus assembly protein FimV [Pseudomonas chlororaphis subsp. aureofaciens]